jgi:hypothetical protein
MNTPELGWSWRRIASFAALVAVGVTALGVWLSAQGGPQLSFGQLVASPPNIVFNKPTNVTFTIRIDTPTLNPTTVQLQRVDAQGTVLGSLGRMYDTGTNGDPVADDRNFTAVVSLNEPTVGKSYFRVGAAFRGNKQNAQSAVTPLEVDPFPIPPDPGEAGKATLEGIDSDKDGVRDDVQRWIGVTSDSPRLRMSLRDSVVAFQMALLASSSDKASVQAASSAQTAAARCFAFTSDGLSRPAQLLSALAAQVMNTSARVDAYKTYASAFRSLRIEDEPAPRTSTFGKYCSVDPSTLN